MIGLLLIQTCIDSCNYCTDINQVTVYTCSGKSLRLAIVLSQKLIIKIVGT